MVDAARCAPQSLQNLAPAGFSWPQDWQFTGLLPILASSPGKSRRTDGGGRESERVNDRSADSRRLIGHRFHNPCDGMRNARLKREDAFSHAMIIVISAMVSSS